MSDTKRFALVFPGQGSQSIGMLKALAGAYPVVAETFAEARDVLGFDVWDITQNGPEEQLNRTTVTQPALLAADIACYRAWRAAGGPVPNWTAGHSLGEYAALVCAGALEFADALTLVAHRGRLMQEAVPEGTGAMAAILGLEDQVVEKLCNDSAAGEVLAAVNYNAPGQVVIAGTKAAVDRAIAGAKAVGAKRAILLAVSVPSHCALMRPAALKFAEKLAPVAIRPLAIPVIHNWNVDQATSPEQVREALVNQLFSPVRWVETIRRIAEFGATTVLECGPGKVLTGLDKRIVDLPCQALGEPADLLTAVAGLR
ncbi:MAG TPA: ACP S-malonyltransferase [Acidiferrobacter sp.]|nr:ACP S-malonyltransferase [Acidiferrobacter sp.]